MENTLSHFSLRIIQIILGKHKSFFVNFFLRPILNYMYIVWTDQSSKKISPTLEYKFFSELKVKKGPFKGMLYPEIKSVGSSIYPKLLGTYERELHSSLEALLEKNQYSEIINVGCAEGYYAVGLAMRLPQTSIRAFDTNPNAIVQSKQMAELNKVNNIIFHSELTPEALETFVWKERTLVVCDIEGYEKKLFTLKNISNLAHCDFIIEVHDLIKKGIGDYLKDLFKSTHTIHSIQSIHDLERPFLYNDENLEGLSYNDKRKLLTEQRWATMEWIVCEPKTKDNQVHI